MKYTYQTGNYDEQIGIRIFVLHCDIFGLFFFHSVIITFNTDIHSIQGPIATSGSSLLKQVGV